MNVNNEHPYLIRIRIRIYVHIGIYLTKKYAAFLYRNTLITISPEHFDVNIVYHIIL